MQASEWELNRRFAAFDLEFVHLHICIDIEYSHTQLDYSSDSQRCKYTPEGI